jgi:hypothetical protein
MESQRVTYIELYNSRHKGQHPLGNLPVVVLTPGKNNTPDSQARDRSLAQLSTRGEQVVANGSGHEIHLEQPKLVINAIEKVVGMPGSPRRNSARQAALRFWLAGQVPVKARFLDGAPACP